MEKGIIIDVLATGLEGGINYWACLDNTTKEWESARNKVKQETNDNYVIEDVMYELLINGNGVKFEDAEQEEDSSDWILTMDKLLNGIEQWCEIKNIRHFEKYYDNSNDFDCCDADCIYQLALFNDVIFG